MWPNFILGGAPKSGTSSLYFWLDAHPDVGSSKAKEPFFFFDNVNRFNNEANVHDHGLEKYPELFAHQAGKKVIFEASAPYIYSQTALEYIPKLPSQPKVLFVLREPSARLFSKYRFNRYKLHNIDHDFRTYCTSQDADFPAGKHVDEGHYHRYLQAWKEALGNERLKVMLFEEMHKDPRRFLKLICEWLEIDSSFYEHYDFPKHNETFSTRSGGFHKKAVSLLPLVPVFLREPLGGLYRKLNSGKMPEPTTEELELKKELQHYYKADREALLELFPDLPLEFWGS